MIINNLFNCTQNEFENYKSRDLVSLSCIQCHQDYLRTKKGILDAYTKHQTHPKFCSQQCNAAFKKQERNVKATCAYCNKSIFKLLNQSLKYKNHFCSSSCNASYQNKNKIKGTRRSKLEVFLEQKLSELRPNLKVLYSDKTTIGSELDIYIPSLKLAFEIQGIFHYEPIFGQEKLEQIQKNDLEKQTKCEQFGITLIPIDTQLQKRFTEKSSMKYLEEILKYL